MPQTFIIDGKGKLRYHKIGGFDEESLNELKFILNLLIIA